MKKIMVTIISVFLLSIFSVKAENLPVYVDGTMLTDETSTVSLGDGTLKYDKAKKELTLENITLTSNDNYGINLTGEEDTKIILKGNNKITVTGINFGIRSSSNLVITGDGTLTISASFPALKSTKAITIDNAVLDLTTTEEHLTAIENDKGLIIKNGSKVTAKGSGSAISSYAKAEITDSELELEAVFNNSNAIYVEATNGDGTLTITNSKVKAKSGFASIYSTGLMKLNNSTFTLDSIAGGIYTNTAVQIKDSKVNIRSGNYGIGVDEGGYIKIDNSTFEITVNDVSFKTEPTLENMENKVVYAGYETDGTDAELLEINDNFYISNRNYVKIMNKYTIKVTADENVLYDQNKEMTALEGEDKELVIKAKEGYKIKSVLVNDNNVNLTDDKLSLKDIKENIIVKINTEKITLENPETSDNIGNFITLGIISVLTLTLSKVFITRKNEVN